MARKIGKRDCRYLAKLVVGDRVPCAFCRREVDDEATYGKLYAIGDIQCHYLCALLSCCLVQKGREEEGLFGFMYKDIVAELERSKKHKCSFCGRGGANLGCSVSSCRKQFHLPCGREKNAVTLFYGSYKSFCQIHAPKQKVPEHIMCKARLRMKKTAAIDKESQCTDEMVCVICYEVVDAFPSVNTFWPPCCARDAWFHRSCLQRMTLSAGMHYLKCPLCNDKENFYDAVINQGYYVPDRDAAWELEQNAFAEIYERPLSCTADTCLCPKGRSHDSDQGKWDIKLCLLCGSVGAHAHCIGASETTRYVCLTCTPAAPENLQALADTIEKLILKEQADSASTVRHGPVMPSRMSLRRTKGRVALLNRPSSSRAHDIKAECNSTDQSPNIRSSRQELNLKSPRKLIHADSPRKSINHPYKPTETISPNKELSLYGKHTESYSLNSKSPVKVLEGKDSYNIEAGLLSPMKILELSIQEKVMLKENTVLDERIMDILRIRFKKPQPLSKKKKIVDDILGGLFDNVNNSFKQKEPIRGWCSPKKCNNITNEDDNKDATSDNAPKYNENLTENKENCMQDTPRKPKRIKDTASNNVQITKNKIELDKTPNKESNVINGDGKHRLITENKEVEGEPDDSSNSTFQLSSEFIADTVSDDSLSYLSPKRKTIDIKQDSSLEISEQDHSVNINVIKINDSGSDIKNKRAFKFSRLDNENLDDNNVGIDIDSFTKDYLSEVDRQFKCNFNHNHNSSKATTSSNVNFRSAIDFAMDVHSSKDVMDGKRKKRKTSPSSALNRDKNEAKKCKVSDHLDISYSSDDFEVKKELNLSQSKKVNSPVKERIETPDRDKKKKKTVRDLKSSSYSKERRQNKKQSREYVKNYKSNENMIVRDKNKKLTKRRLHSEEKCVGNTDQDTSEKNVNNKVKSNDDYKKLKNKDRNSLVIKLGSKDNSYNSMKQTIKSNNDRQLKDEDKRIEDGILDKSSKKIKLDTGEKRSKVKHRSNSCNNKQKDAKNKQDKKLNSKEKRIKQRIQSNERNIPKDKHRVTAEDKKHTNTDKYEKLKKRLAEKHVKKLNKHAKDTKSKDNQNIEVSIDSFKSKSKNKKTKVSISNNVKDISVKIKWKKKLLRLKIESKKDKVEKDNSKFKQYVLQYFSEVTPKEVLVKPEKEVSPLKRKYVKQEKTTTPDKLKQMSIQNFFKVKSPSEKE